MSNTTYTVVSNPSAFEGGSLHVLFAGESQTKPLHRLGPRIYDFYLLHHVISGKGTFTSLQQSYSIEPGQSFLIQPDQLVSYEADEYEPWHYRWVAFTGPGAPALVKAAGFTSAQPLAGPRQSRSRAVLLRQIQRVFQEQGQNAHLQAGGYLMLLMGALAETSGAGTVDIVRPGNDGEQLVQQVIRYLSSQYTEAVSIEAMAETLGYNRAYLSRLFKQRTGLSPMTFLIKLRVDKARFLLRERLELTIEQTASSVGFHDPLYFSKQFRRFYGHSPSAYREMIRQARK
ncbi:helix-turn-helix domain-containing protein [Paenibacillus sp. GCM10012307]|uniref:AraC family transcriptional regulator n=1 Tax=Paenibacillus roseus TaxID=2798579 RepID=A0A934J4F1_9BACL|nr:AraC family transcriptional regulator [Paenibacillus roseus]MBJ6361338.1 AraC family transcriptional regulator [Paenibacillus roseus]